MFKGSVVKVTAPSFDGDSTKKFTSIMETKAQADIVYAIMNSVLVGHGAIKRPLKMKIIKGIQTFTVDSYTFDTLSHYLTTVVKLTSNSQENWDVLYSIYKADPENFVAYLDSEQTETNYIELEEPEEASPYSWTKAWELHQVWKLKVRRGELIQELEALALEASQIDERQKQLLWTIEDVDKELQLKQQ